MDSGHSHALLDRMNKKQKKTSKWDFAVTVYTLDTNTQVLTENSYTYQYQCCFKTQFLLHIKLFVWLMFQFSSFFLKYKHWLKHRMINLISGAWFQ